ncbi:MAG: hypothetical protein A2138_04700 [Deltaproteobacteria bacterium RBG_16_71_12]|nr:MAG: hypothetical protein A2138_04700 [Deltaproteobacteria bacterium RBG_16_71_12]
MFSGATFAARLALALLPALAACGVAPVQRGEVPSGPPVWRYLGQHGRPLAYDGGVCTIKVPHEHKYPPAPRAAFVETADGLADTRPIVPYVGRHPHRGRTCTEQGWHLHLEGPDAHGMVFDEQVGAWRALAAERRPSNG